MLCPDTGGWDLRHVFCRSVVQRSALRRSGHRWVVDSRRRKRLRRRLIKELRYVAEAGPRPPRVVAAALSHPPPRKHPPLPTTSFYSHPPLPHPPPPPPTPPPT